VDRWRLMFCTYVIFAFLLVAAQYDDGNVKVLH
jgi:hypothetical protein